MLCQAYQQIQCAGNSCSVGAHVCAMVDRDSSHGRGTKHPACKHRWGKKAAESDALQTYDYVQAPLGGTTNYHARLKRFAASLPRDRVLAIPKETDEARGKMVKIDEARRRWTERVRGPRACMVIHQIMVERAHFWIGHEKPRERQPTAPSQPPPATRTHRQADFTPRAVGTGATKNRDGRVLGHSYQQNQCAGDSRSIGTHGCTTMCHDSGHVCNIWHPACEHRWDKKSAEQENKEHSMKDKRWWNLAVGIYDSSRTAVGQRQVADVGQYLGVSVKQPQPTSRLIRSHADKSLPRDRCVADVGPSTFL